jgi:glutamate/tyrosine decarboxylase-like PLP-dependent enzyme
MPGILSAVSVQTPLQGTIEAEGLFASEVRRQEIEHRLTRLLAEAAKSRHQKGVAATIDFAAAEAIVAQYDFLTEADLSDVLAWVIRHMSEGMTQIAHPRYFGLFNPAPAFASECADRIAAFFNPQLASATTSPFPVAVERHVIRTVAHRLGMPRDTAGHFTSGGSEANATAAISALTHAEPRYAEWGIRAFAAQPCIYVSSDAHLAWLKIGHQIGIGRSAIRLVPTDGMGVMDAIALEHKIAADLQTSSIPALIVSTAGTTNAGMIDDIRANDAIARRYGAWHHVDAAWGGGLVASDRFSASLGGIDLADSVTIDAHKWLATTMGCGMFMTSHADILAKAFHATMECMPSNNAAIDPYLTTMQWSRRFIGIRLFVGLASSGWSGYGRHIEKAIDHATLLRHHLISRGWQVANASPLAVLCLRPPPGSLDVRSIAARIIESGEAWLSTVNFEGDHVVRVCMTNGASTRGDVLRLGDLLVAYSGVS